MFALLSLAAVGFITALTPGPDILFVLRNTLSYGARIGFLSLLGIFCGWIIFLSLVYFGFAHFIQGADTRPAIRIVLAIIAHTAPSATAERFSVR